MTPLPRPLIDAGPFAQWLNQLRKCVAERTPQTSPTARVSRTQSGFYYVTIPGESGAASSPGMVFRGEWRGSVADYLEGNVVVIRGGISAGCYVALRDVPQGTEPAFPDTGIYWASISRNFAGAWA